MPTVKPFDHPASVDPTQAPSSVDLTQAPAMFDPYEDDDLRQARQTLEQIAAKRAAQESAASKAATAHGATANNAWAFGSGVGGARVELSDGEAGLVVRIVDTDGLCLDTLHGAKAMIFLSGFLRCEVWATDRALDVAERAGRVCEIRYHLRPEAPPCPLPEDGDEPSDDGDGLSQGGEDEPV